MRILQLSLRVKQEMRWCKCRRNGSIISGMEKSMQILSVNDDEFKKYGRVVDNVDFTELIQELKRTPIPSGVVYEPAVKELEALPIRLDISSVVYGEMPIQIGYCNGHIS